MIEASGVAAAIEINIRKIYVGVCVDTACTLGMCRGVNAIFRMITRKMPSAGYCNQPYRKSDSTLRACREFMTQLMPDSYRTVEIMMDYETNKVVTLGELTPEWWI